MSVVNKYLDCETTSISSESLFRLLIYSVDSDIHLRVYNNGTSNDSLQPLLCDNPLSIEDIFRELIVYDLNNNPALNIA